MNVLILGASRGIGLALAQEYAAAGANLFVTVRSKSSAAPLLALGTSVTVIDGVELADDAAPGVITSALGSQAIDIAILNAGVLYSGGFSAVPTTADIYRESFQVNALSPLRVAQALVANGNVKEGGKIVFISTFGASLTLVKTFGQVLPKDESADIHAYRVSKAALNMCAALLTEDVRARSITVAMMHPGAVDTDLLKSGGTIKEVFETTKAAEIISTNTSATKIISAIGALTQDSTGSFINATSGEPLLW